MENKNMHCKITTTLVVTVLIRSQSDRRYNACMSKYYNNKYAGIYFLHVFECVSMAFRRYKCSCYTL